MSKQNNTLACLFFKKPDPYNAKVVELLMRLRDKLPTEDFQAFVQESRNQLRDIDNALDREFELLLMEQHIGECLCGFTQLNPAEAANYLECLGFKDYPKMVNDQPDCGMDFWEWFEALPKATKKQVWDAVGEKPYG